MDTSKFDIINENINNTINENINKTINETINDIINKIIIIENVEKIKKNSFIKRLVNNLKFEVEQFQLLELILKWYYRKKLI